MAFTSQETVDAAFADLHALLQRDECVVDASRCVHCNGWNLQRSANPGATVHYCNICSDCGAVQSRAFGMVDAAYYPARKSYSNYKRIHHWHERISQLLLCESPIPDDVFLEIAARLCDGTHAVLSKDAIRSVLRSLNKQMYIEKWLQIIQRITGIEPPKPGAQLLCQLDELFTALQEPFKHHKTQGRKNFLNYNYCFARLFQKMGCEQYSMFFPLIKSKGKLKQLDDTWQQMVSGLGWEVTPLVSVPPFAVKLQQPDVLLARLRQRVASAVPAAPRTALERTGCHMSDLHLLRALDRQTWLRQRRSNPPAQLPQRAGSLKRKLPCASAAGLRPLHRSRILPRLG